MYRLTLSFLVVWLPQELVCHLYGDDALRKAAVFHLFFDRSLVDHVSFHHHVSSVTLSWVVVPGDIRQTHTCYLHLLLICVARDRVSVLRNSSSSVVMS